MQAILANNRNGLTSQDIQGMIDEYNGIPHFGLPAVLL
jgi:hypothetical protein